MHEDGNNGNGDSSADGSGDDGGMVRSLSLWNYFTMGFGAIIDTGWVLLVGDWMIVGGGPVEAMIAFVLGAVFLLPIGSASGAVTTVGSFLPGVLVMTPFFYAGFDTIPQSAEETSEGLDWKKFGMVISASLLAPACSMCSAFTRSARFSRGSRPWPCRCPHWPRSRRSACGSTCPCW